MADFSLGWKFFGTRHFGLELFGNRYFSVQALYQKAQIGSDQYVLKTIFDRKENQPNDLQQFILESVHTFCRKGTKVYKKKLPLYDLSNFVA